MQDDHQKHLASTASVGLFGLALRALMADGHATAMRTLDELQQGSARLGFTVATLRDDWRVRGVLELADGTQRELFDLVLVDQDLETAIHRSKPH